MSPRTWIRCLLVAATAALSLGACATPYAAREDGGFGYADHYVADGIFYVEFAYNGFTSDGQAQRSFERRCAEVCDEEGFAGWELVESSPSEDRVQGATFVQTWDRGRPSTHAVSTSQSLHKITGHVRCLTGAAIAQEQEEMGGPSPLGPVRDPEEDDE